MIQRKMGYEISLAKSCSRVEPQKLGLYIFAGCFLFTLVLISFSESVRNPLPQFGLRLTNLFVSQDAASHQTSGSEEHVDLRSEELSLLSVNDSVRKDDVVSKIPDVREKKQLCDFSDPRSDICEMDGDIRIQGNSSSILFIRSIQESPQEEKSWLIKPHPRKLDRVALTNVRQMTVKSVTERQEALRCEVNHSVPAIVFSTGGYMGNIFHDFTDVLIPVFLTSRQFNLEVQFMISEELAWWVAKYELFLKQLSRYEIINFNKEERVHCYPRVIVGLRSHKEMSIDPSRDPNGYSMVDFAELMRKSYSLKRTRAIKLDTTQSRKPRLLIIARKGTRSFKNIDEIVQMAEELNYEVVVAGTDATLHLTQFARVVNSCDVMMGVHGAGLTNVVFLPINATVIQVVPFGGLGEMCRVDFGEPSLDMKLRYLQYEVSEDESTLIEMYPRDHPVFKNPGSIHKQGWSAVANIYLTQSVRLDVGKFRGYLVKALEFLHQ